MTVNKYYDTCPYEELLEAEKHFELVRERDLSIKRLPAMFIKVGGYSVEGLTAMSKDEFSRVFWESLEYERILKDVVAKMLVSADWKQGGNHAYLHGLHK